MLSRDNTFQLKVVAVVAVILLVEVKFTQEGPSSVPYLALQPTWYRVPTQKNLKSARVKKVKDWKSVEVASTATNHELYAAVSKCNSAPLHYSNTENHYTRSAKRKLFDFLCFHYAVVLSCIPMLLQKVHGERLLMPLLTNSQIWPFPLLLTFTFLV